MIKFIFSINFILFSGFLYASTTTSEEQTQAKQELEWGSVLFDYYQKDYFSALVEYEYAAAINNSVAKSVSGKLLQGGMLLSYGLADESHEIFQKVLDQGASPDIRNKAWYYLANLYYHKSQPNKAYDALQQVVGQIPKELHPEYHYLATLVNNSAEHLTVAESVLDSLPENHPHYPYIVFNIAIQQLRQGNVASAITRLQQVVSYELLNKELAMLADRAKHGLAQIALQQGQNLVAWNYLTAIRTQGLYSNRALLTYAWTAIKLKQFNDAVAALEILNERSIAIPEVQEAKVLLAHLYEQEGSPRKALRANLLAIDAFEKGVAKVDEARRIIAKQEVPKEFIQNLDVIIDDTDWFGSQPSVDYQKLTPFLIDLMSSKVLNETLKELSDLYAIQRNLKYWSRQANEHQLIINNAQSKSFDIQDKSILNKSELLKQMLDDKKAELKLHTLTLTEKQQARFKSLIENIEKELALLSSKVDRLQLVDKPYQQPKVYLKQVAEKHQQIKLKLAKTNQYVSVLEPVVRSLVNSELDKHEERMRYYWAQSRLAKARLYDTTLMNLDKAKHKAKQKQTSVDDEQKEY
ncbi:tetratricopeptide repeat protein [Aliikangiella sp. IMCC44359]|uniref:tetratricopeptide repeat protein n=1 Tax=Aliikangiella sp. IMCC44359 TaxID=3459125 RepID=UPI00403B379F